MLRVSICDDDVATLSQLEELVRQYLDPRSSAWQPIQAMESF